MSRTVFRVRRTLALECEEYVSVAGDTLPALWGTMTAAERGEWLTAHDFDVVTTIREDVMQIGTWGSVEVSEVLADPTCYDCGAPATMVVVVEGRESGDTDYRCTLDGRYESDHGSDVRPLQGATS